MNSNRALKSGSAAPQGSVPQGDQAAATAPRRALPAGAVATAAFFIAMLAYLGLFYSDTDQLRTKCFLLALIPDTIVANWFDHDPRRIAVLDRLPLLFVASIVLLSAYCAGHWIVAWLVPQGLTRLERFVFAMGVGLNVISLYTLAVGLGGGLRRAWLFWIPMVLLFAITSWRAWSERKRSSPDGNRAAQKPSGEDTDGLVRWGLWLAAPFVLLYVWFGMQPPWEFDVREYHLQVPKEWYQLGYIGFLPHNVYGNMPLGSEMHALLSMVLMPGPLDWWYGALAGKLVLVFFTFVTSLALVAAGRRLFSARAGVIAALVYLTVPWVFHVSAAGLIEGAYACYLWLATYAVLIWMLPQDAAEENSTEGNKSAGAPRGNGPLALAGLLAGGAAACKYPAVVFVVIPLMALVLFHRWSLNWRPTCVFLFAVALACGLWYGKNWVLAGNPTYPLLYRVFHGKTRTASKDQQWRTAHSVPPNAQGRRYSLVQLRTSLRQLAWHSDWLSPLLVPFAALSLFARRYRRRVLLLVALLVYMAAVWWLITHRHERFLVPTLPLVAMLAGAGAVCCCQPVWRRTVLSFLTLGLLVNLLVFATGVTGGDSRILVSLDALRRDEEQFLRVHPAHRFLNRVVPDGYKALMVGEAQVFDIETGMLYNTCFDDCIFETLLKDKSREERLEALRRHKVSHVFVHWLEVQRYRQPGNYGFTNFVTRELIENELVRQQGILREVVVQVGDAVLNRQTGQVFEVVGVTGQEEGRQVDRGTGRRGEGG